MDELTKTVATRGDLAHLALFLWASGASALEAIARMDRALREFRIRGVSTNLQFLENVILHPLFKSGDCTT
eukprot:gene42231-57176_t